MSPTIVNFLPLSFGLCCSIVYMSRSAWLGCSFHPSPAFITAAFMFFAKKSAAPENPVLITTMSGCIWSIVIAVSRRVSPFFREELLPEMLMVSAPRFFPASSKEVLVLVDSSMKKFI